MRRIICSTVSLIICLLLMTGIAASANNSKLEVINPPHSMLVLGDSISTGCMLYSYKKGNNYNTQSYANLVASDLHLSQERSYLNLASDGLTSQELLTNLRDGKYDKAIDSELILLTIGGNDLLGEFLEFLKESIGLDLIDISGTSINADFTNPELMAKLNELISNIDSNISGFSETFSEILSLIREKNKDAYIICQTVYNPLECLPIPDSVKNIFDGKINLLNQNLRSCVRTQNQDKVCVEVIDVYHLFDGKSADMTNMLDGDIHPNASGHKKIYEAVKSSIEKHSFPTPTDTSTTESDSVPVSGRLDEIEKSESSSVLIMCAFVGVFGICLLSAIIVFIIRKKHNKI